MGELAQEITAKLEAAWATTPLAQIILERGGALPPRDEPLIEETLTTLLEYQRAVAEAVVRVAHEVDRQS